MPTFTAEDKPSAQKFSANSAAPDTCLSEHTPTTVKAFLAAHPPAHFVCAWVGIDASGDKHLLSLAPAWQKSPPSLASVEGHLRRRPRIENGVTHYPLVGVMPQSLGCVVADVDEGGVETVNAIQGAFPGSLALPTRKDTGFHVWLRLARDTQDKIGNAKWRAFGGGGDLRAGKGFVFLWWAGSALTAVSDWLAKGADEHPADVLLTAFPKPPKPDNDAPSKAGKVRRVRSDVYQKGDRNNTLNSRAFKAFALGKDEAAIDAERTAAIAAGLPAEEADRTIASARTAGREAGQRLFPRCDRRALQGAFAALEIEARKDVRAAAYQYKDKAGDWQNIIDETAEHLRALLSEEFRYQRAEDKIVPLQFSKEGFWSALMALAGKSPDVWLVDPFRLYVESMPPWDEKPRLDSLLHRALGVDMDALGIWASRYMVLGPLQRAYKPGSELKESPVLCGAQRLGKSPLIAALFPECHRSQWFGDTLRFSGKPQEMVEATLGRVLVEYAELAAVQVKDNEGMKAFLSRRVDNGVRLAYARLPVILERRYAVIFTTNEDDPLPNDASGHSRYVPVQCKSGTDMDVFMDGEREQLWAEGLWRWRRGEKANLPRDLYEAQERATGDARTKDAALEDQLAEMPVGCALKLSELATRCGLNNPLSYGDQYRLLRALKNDGWKNRHLHVGNRWVKVGR